MLVLVAICKLSLVLASGVYSLVAVHGLLIAVASVIVAHKLQGAQASAGAAHRLSSCGTRA